MDVRGVVVSVEMDVQVAKNGGGTYPGTRFSYRDDNGALKEQGFHQNTFKFNAGLKTQLANLNPGQKFVMNKTKEGDFWKVNSILPDDGAVNVPQQGTTTGGKATPTASPKSTYETSEERALKQIYIVRQSSLSAAIALVNATGDKKATPQSIITQAKVFENYVFDKEQTTKSTDSLDFQDDSDDVIM